MRFDISGHAIWANSKAFEVAGITRETRDPEGGIVERAADGTPSGVLRETARDLILSKIPPPTPEENVQALKKGLDMLASRGVVALLDAMVLRDGVAAYTELADRGQLKQTVVGCIAYSHAGKPMPYFDEVIAKRDRYARPRFHPSCVKVFVDGVPTEGRTAAMLAPYAGGDPKAPPKGLLLVDPQVLNSAVARWDSMGLTTLFHAAGDGAVRASLDAIEYARRVNGPHGPRHQVGHSTFIAREDFPRAKPLNATIEFSPYLWYPGPINDDIIKAIGPKRIERVWPLRDGVESGALIVLGSDWAVVPDPNPWVAIETAITRRVPGGGNASYGPGQAVTLRQAIDMFTVNPAKQFGIDGGTLEAGKPADFIVLDRDPFALPPTKLHTVKVEATYVAGEVIWEKGRDAAR
jgi:predicted amidohydrolase YtcJ